eukprot:scaffold856_cov326-Pavlova_lutheri.AAC.20
MEEWQRELADVLSWNHQVRLRDVFGVVSLRSHEGRLAFVVCVDERCFVPPFLPHEEPRREENLHQRCLETEVNDLVITH